MNTSVATILGLGIALASTGCLIGSDAEPSADSHIIGGKNDPGDPAVGVLRIRALDGSVGVCTATLIAPNVMVTAGHCADRANFDVSFDPLPDLSAPPGSRSYTTATVIANPAYTGDPLGGHDVAIVLLARAATAAPVALGAAPARGATVRAVGYGMNVFGNDGTGIGTRRQIAIPVRAVAAHEIVTGSDGASTCHGDSGGPLFDAAGSIVATTSYGDTADCRGTSHDMRIDDNRDFLAKYLGGAGGGGAGGGGGGGGGGNHCQVNQNGNEIVCDNGVCTCKIDSRPAGTCTAPDPSTACSSPGNCCGF